jgi:large subunit ribosomal protein L6
MRVRIDDGQVTVERPSEAKPHRELHGLTRTLVANMVEGVTNGYRKSLEISGVGYRAQKVGENLQLSLGYSHPVDVEAPAGISFEVETPTRLSVVGIDKELVGQVAARVRSKRKPEPYKGKGVRYVGEQVRRKAGKTGKIGGKK